MAVVRYCGDFKDTYEKDIELFQTPFLKISMVILLIILFGSPLLFSNYLISHMNYIGIMIISAMGLNLLTGYSGQISIGHGAFMGVGAYTTAILTTKLGMPFWVALPASGLSTAIVGLIFGIPAIRLKGIYLIISTMAAQVIIEFIVILWGGVTGGTRGINVGVPMIGSYSLGTEKKIFYLIFSLVILSTLFASNLIRSKPGRAFQAIRDRDIAAELMGINISKYKLLAFLISSFYAGIGGSLWALYTGVINHEIWNLMLSVEYLTIIIVGGMGSILGTIFGSAFMYILPEALHEISMKVISPYFPKILEVFTIIKTGIFGLIIIVCILYEPNGLVAIWEKIKNYFKVWPFAYR